MPAGRRLVEALARKLRALNRRQVALLGDAAALMERVAQSARRIEGRKRG